MRLFFHRLLMHFFELLFFAKSFSQLSKSFLLIFSLHWSLGFNAILWVKVRSLSSTALKFIFCIWGRLHLITLKCSHPDQLLLKLFLLYFNECLNDNCEYKIHEEESANDDDWKAVENCKYFNICIHEIHHDWDPLLCRYYLKYCEKRWTYIVKVHETKVDYPILRYSKIFKALAWVLRIGTIHWAGASILS